MAAVLLDDVSLSLGASWVLAHLSLSLETGGALLVTGDNGAGKTSLLRLMATTLRPQHGRVCLFGEVATGPALPAIRARLALMGHQHHGYEALSATENLGLAGRLANLDGAQAAARIDEVLRRVGLVAHQHRPLGDYSAGMKRRLSLARLLLLEPDLVLLDEPYAQLDRAGSVLMDEVLDELRARGKTLAIVSHEPARLLRRCTARLHLGDTSATVQRL